MLSGIKEIRDGMSVLIFDVIWSYLVNGDVVSRGETRFYGERSCE